MRVDRKASVISQEFALSSRDKKLKSYFITNIIFHVILLLNVIIA